LPSPLHPPRARTSHHTRLGTSNLTHRALSNKMNLVWVCALLRGRLPKVPTIKNRAFRTGKKSDLRNGVLEVLERAAGVECKGLGGRLRGWHVVPERPEVHRYWRGPFFSTRGGARVMHIPIQSRRCGVIIPPSRGMRVLGLEAPPVCPATPGAQTPELRFQRSAERPPTIRSQRSHSTTRGRAFVNNSTGVSFVPFSENRCSSSDCR